MCNQCEVVSINGVNCHEAGCPEAFKVQSTCKCCEGLFVPEFRGDVTCSHSCYVEYWNQSCFCEDCNCEDDMIDVDWDGTK